MSASTTRSRLLGSDVARLGVSGLVSRPTRAVLSALGIAIGIAAMIAVVGISTSSQAKLAATLDELGTDLLSASQGQDFFGETVDLPLTAGASAGRTHGVRSAATTGTVADAGVYRSSMVPEGNTNGITVRSASPTLLDVLDASVAKGVWLTEGMARYPVVVLGAEAAARLGITEPGRHVMIGSAEYVVAGILEPVPLAAEIDSSALIGEQAAEALAGSPVHPTAVYVRADPALVPQVRDLLARSIQPQSPSDVEVTRPSDALAAQQAADQAFTGLLVGLGGVALLVGGIGVANTMVISVLERRREIGLRRALGATRSHIRQQFLAEALFLSLLGGVAGVLLGVAVTGVFAALRGWPLAIPPVVLAAGLGATLVIGALAGLWPAVRAARIPPTEALQS
jgi:putative ABC transport system permease protein